MSTMGGTSRVVAGIAALAIMAATAGCSGSATLRARHASTAGGTAVVNASYTAALTGRRVTLMVPSGRVDLTLTAPLRTVPAEQVERAAPLRAAKGRALVGVSWQLQRAGYTDTPNRQLTEPSAVFGEPQPVRLWLVTDGTRHAIPDVTTLGYPGNRPRTAVWVSVPTGVHAWQFQLDYDGVTQTVDTTSGKVEAGRAAALYRALPLDSRDTCHLAGRNVLTSCLVYFAVGYPYVTGAGWAPSGKTWALVEIVLESNFHGAGSVTVAGAKPGRELGDKAEPISPFLVASGARSLPVRGTVSADDLYRGRVRARLTAELTVAGS
jgi:hypothetical protein